MKFLLFLFVVFVGVRFFIFDFWIVLNSEMLPTLFQNDYIGVQKFFLSKKISRGDVVLIKSPEGNSVIRRIIGKPGDRVFYSEGVLYLNEKAHPFQPPEGVLKKESSFLKESDFKGENFSKDKDLHFFQKDYEHWQVNLESVSHSVLVKKNSSLTFGPYVVPPEHYFVMGDNRASSRDSRTWAMQGQKSQGEVTLLRKKRDLQEDILIPQGTLFHINENPHLPLFFETLSDVVLKKQQVRVSVRSQALTGSIKKGRKWKVPLEFKDVLEAYNDEDFFGGPDKSVIPLENIQGKVRVVFWGCQKRIEFFYFLCQFNSFRKGRWFWRVH